MPKKHDDAKSDEKLLRLYIYLLFSTQPVSRKDIEEKFNCSQQTVGRLLEKLNYLLDEHCGMLEKIKKGRMSLYRLKKSQSPQMLPLDPEGIMQIELCRDFMVGLLPEEDRKKLLSTVKTAKTNIAANKYRQYAEDVVIASGVSKGHIDYTPFQDQIRKLESCIIKRETCIITYKKSLFDEAKVFCFAPQKLIAYHESLNVIGWVVTDSGHVQVLRDHPLNLSVHRIDKVEYQKNRTAENLLEIELPSNKNFGYINGELFTAKIRFSKDVSTYVSERKWSDDQIFTLNDDGSSILEFSSRSKVEVITFVLGFGMQAELLEPINLRESIKEHLKASLKLYE